VSTRTCENQAHGGNDCVGATSKSESCSLTSCDDKWLQDAAFERVYAYGGDWTTVHCPYGKYIMGGGCLTTDSNHNIFQKNAPASNTAWECGGWSMNKEVWAICSTIPTVVETHASGQDWADYGCSSNRQILGGGCISAGGAYKFEASRPWGNADRWRCGGHGAAKDVSLICADKSKIHMDVATRSNAGDWESVACASNYQLLGGGCQSNNPWVMRGMFPDTANSKAYRCGGHGGSKTVFAMCGKRPGAAR
jgi:hypothetical protein